MLVSKYYMLTQVKLPWHLNSQRTLFLKEAFLLLRLTKAYKYIFGISDHQKETDLLKPFSKKLAFLKFRRLCLYLSTATYYPVKISLEFFCVNSINLCYIPTILFLIDAIFTVYIFQLQMSECEINLNDQARQVFKRYTK